MVTDLIQRIQDKNALSDDLISGKRTDHAGIRRYDPIVAHHEILIHTQGDRLEVAGEIPLILFNVLDIGPYPDTVPPALSVNIDNTVPAFDRLVGQRDTRFTQYSVPPRKR